MATSAAPPSSMDEELEKQAQEMAEKALPASLPEAVRAAKLPAVKQKILERLKAQRNERTVALPASGGAKVLGSQGDALVPVRTDKPPPPPAQPPPPGMPPPPGVSCPTQTIERIDGVELCGDEPWFCDPSVRQRLRDSIAEAHKEQKILVAAPADEVNRICPQDGRVLGAGAVLRLGGAHLGGYGESDVAYAYRQLSRALHPDKNPDLPKAPAAFHRLSEAAEELRQGLNEQRTALQMIVASMSGQATPEMLERPQEALFAEACRLLTAVVGIVGEGDVVGPAQGRAVAAFARSTMFYNCQLQPLISEWFERNQLLELYASFPLRTAYDCAPKRYRAQFLCLLNRAAVAEAKRCGDFVRASWQGVMQTFPELSLWRELREGVRKRVWEENSVDTIAQQYIPNGRSRSRHRGCSRDRPADGRGAERRRRSRDDDDDDAETGAGRSKWDLDGRRHESWQGKERGRGQQENTQNRQKDLEWDSRWTTSDDPDRGRERQCDRERERGRRKAITMHPQMGWTTCRWGRKWRTAISSVLPSAVDSAASVTDAEVRKLAAALWKDIAEWASSSELDRCLGLLKADHQTSKTFGWDSKGEQAAAARGLEPGAPPAVWAFVPLADLLLAVGEGIVGLTTEGIFADNPAGHRRLLLAQCYKTTRSKKTSKVDDKRMGKRFDEKKNGQVSTRDGPKERSL